MHEQQQCKQAYEEQGYFVLKNYFTTQQIEDLRSVILTFHTRWKTENKTFYQEEAFNASLITGRQYLSSADRVALFNFIANDRLMQVVNHIIDGVPAFMNTQLFFDPFNPEQTTFWHRDCQYDYDIEDQKKIMQNTQVIHFRVPLFDEPGMEIIPGSHKRWDTQEELDVRQEQNNRLSSEPLSNGHKVPLNAGDLFVFSADMIHRGLYGSDRLAFDILVFDATGSGTIYADYVDSDCLPNNKEISKIIQPELFLNTLSLIGKA